MCDPVSIAVATAGISAGTAALSFSAAGQQAKGARQAAGINYGQTYNAEADRSNQISAQRSENHVDATIAKLKAQGRISAAAGSLGLADATVAAAGNAAGFEVGRDASIRDLNSENSQAQVLRDLTAAGSARDASISANQGPSSLELLFGLAKAGLKGVNAYQSAGGTF